MSTPPVIDIEGLRVTVGGRVLLDLPRLRVHAGERIAIIGPNGAGKSTLMRTLSGFAEPAAGRVQVLGQTLSPGKPSRATLRALRLQVGQLLQGLHLVARLSALDNTLIGALGRLRGADAWRSWLRLFPRTETDAARQALHAVGLSDRATTRVDRLSGGERQKVAMARLLVQRPQLVLADEPTASLDPEASRAACALLVQATRGAALVVVVHEPALLPLLAERVIGLRAGQRVFDLPLAQVDTALLAELYRRERQPPLPETSDAQADAVVAESVAALCLR